MMQETHFQLKLLTTIFFVVLAAALFAHFMRASDVMQASLNNITGQAFAAITTIITKDRLTQRSDDPKDKGPENRTLGV